MAHLLLILHMLAQDIQLPGDFNERLTSITERYVEPVELLPAERPVLVSMPEVAPIPTKRAASEGIDQAALSPQAERAIVVDVASGAMLFGKNEDQPAPIASITKLM